MVNRLTKETVESFLDRFYRMGDGLILRIEYEYCSDGKKRLTVVVCVKELNLSSTLMLVVDDVREFFFREKEHSLRVMSMGISIDWFESAIWIAFQPYSTDMTSIEDYRQSDFYVAGHSCYWEIVDPLELGGGKR
jgi:hypothetical protein